MNPGPRTPLCNAAHPPWGRNGPLADTASRERSLEEMRLVLKESEIKARCVKGPAETQITGPAHGEQGSGSASSAELGRGHSGAGHWRGRIWGWVWGSDWGAASSLPAEMWKPEAIGHTQGGKRGRFCLRVEGD